MRIYHEKAGIISKERCWVGIHNYYLYIEDTLPKLLWKMITEWNNDKHIVGY